MAHSDRRRRLQMAAGFLVGAVAIGVLVGSSLPLVEARDRVVLRDTLEPPFDPREFLSPLAGYRHLLLDEKDKTLFTVEGLPEGVPIRLATLDQYDGLVWHMTSGAGLRRGASGYFERMGETMPPAHDGEHRTITVNIEAPSEEWTEGWLPTVGEVVGIRFLGPRAQQLEQAFRYSAGTDTAVAQGRQLQPGDSYVMEVVLPADAQEVPSPEVNSARGCEVANGIIPPAVTNWAERGRTQLGLWQRIESLAEQLGSGLYSSGGEEDLTKVPGGHSAARMVEFVEGTRTEGALAGNAEQYSSAFALGLCTLGIPSRVTVGFQPREWKQGKLTITGDDAEAWVEVPLRDVGWAWLNPTPDRDANTTAPTPQPRPQPEANTQVPLPPPVRVSDPQSDPAEENDNGSGPPPDVTDGGGNGLPFAVVVGGVVVLSPLLLFGTPIALIVWLKMRRRRRRRIEGSTSERVANGFREVLDAVTDLSRPLPSNSTRRELAGFIGTSNAPRLASAADHLVFSAEVPSEDHVASFWHSVETTINELHAQVGWVGRWKARVNLTSLRNGRRK